LTLVVVEHPRSIVIAVPQLDRGRLTPLDRDLLGAARLLADADGGAVLAVVEQACTDDLGTAGADRVVRLQPPATNPGQVYLPAAAAAALVELAQQYGAAHLLFGDAPGGGADLGRRVAARLGVHPAVHVKLAGAHETVSVAAGGRTEWVRKPPRVMLVEPGCAEPVAGSRREARELPAVTLEASPGLVDLGAVKVDRNAVPLAEAELILSAGAGVTDWSAFHALAARLGAAEAGSRVVCDLGHLPRDRQVGASGTIVEPRAYVALGISGAPQHLQGIARCERVVAVNADAHAPMIQRADLAIVGDVQRVMPALAALIEKEAPHG
jgi:electron transfer flavoprotein alpha subunit